MHDPQFVNVLDGIQELMVHLRSLELVHSSVVNDVVEQFAVLHILHNQEKILGSLDDLVELDDVRVPHSLQDVDLPRHSLHVGHVHYTLLL